MIWAILDQNPERLTDKPQFLFVIPWICWSSRSVDPPSDQLLSMLVRSWQSPSLPKMMSIGIKNKFEYVSITVFLVLTYVFWGSTGKFIIKFMILCSESPKLKDFVIWFLCYYTLYLYKFYIWQNLATIDTWENQLSKVK